MNRDKLHDILDAARDAEWYDLLEAAAAMIILVSLATRTKENLPPTTVEILDSIDTFAEVVKQSVRDGHYDVLRSLGASYQREKEGEAA